MATLGGLASLIRSRNAGPFELAFDNAATYARVKRSGAVSRVVVAALCGLPPHAVKFFFADRALAIKASIPRPVFRGNIGNPDGHGGQRYAPLIDIEVGPARVSRDR